MAAGNDLFYSVWVAPPLPVSRYRQHGGQDSNAPRTFPRLEAVPYRSLAEFYSSGQLITDLLAGGVAGERR